MKILNVRKSMMEVMDLEDFVRIIVDGFGAVYMQLIMEIINVIFHDVKNQNMEHGSVNFVI